MKHPSWLPTCLLLWTSPNSIVHCLGLKMRTPMRRRRCRQLKIEGNASSLWKLSSRVIEGSYPRTRISLERCCQCSKNENEASASLPEGVEHEATSHGREPPVFLPTKSTQSLPVHSSQDTNFLLRDTPAKTRR